MSYSQRDEERYILRMKGHGRYLDIGAYDSKTFSNIRALAERGWTGTVVEPAAAAFAAMLNDPPPGAKLVNAMVGPRTGLASFLHSRDAISTTVRAHADRWSKATTYQPVFVGSITIFDLLKDFPGPYRFINVDCEGTSMWVFSQLVPLLDDLEVEMICVEHDGARVHVPGWREIYRSPENSIIRRIESRSEKWPSEG